VWNCAKGGLINGTVPEGQSITGATIVAVLPKDVTSFTLSIKDIAFVSPLVQRDSWQDFGSGESEDPEAPQIDEPARPWNRQLLPGGRAQQNLRVRVVAPEDLPERGAGRGPSPWAPV